MVRIAPIAILIFLSGCGDNSVSTTPPVEVPSQVVFRSGFESGVTLDPPTILGDEWSQFIRGSDQGFSWETDLPERPSVQNRFTYLVSSALPLAQLTDYVDTRLESLPGWDGNPTRALYMELKKDDPLASQVTRNQFGIYPDATLTQAYMRYRVKLQPDLDVILPQGLRRSLMVMEWKETGQPRADFRWNIFVQRAPNVEALYWRTQAQFGDLEDSPQAWECVSGVAAPVGEWFTLEVFWRLDPVDGRVWATVNGNSIVDYRGRTQKDSELFVWWPFKLYVGGALSLYPDSTFYQWVDDVEIQTDIPEASRNPSVSGTNTCQTF